MSYDSNEADLNEEENFGHSWVRPGSASTDEVFRVSLSLLIHIIQIIGMNICREMIILTNPLNNYIQSNKNTKILVKWQNNLLFIEKWSYYPDKWVPT
jgi:hypothetical protein